MRASEARRRSRRKKLSVTVLIFNVIFYTALALGFIFVLFHIVSPKKSLRNEGVKLFEEGSYEEALSKFDEAISEKQWFSDALDVDILLYRADCLIRMDRYNEAVSVYNSIKTDYDKKYWEKRELDYLISINETLNKFYAGDYISTVAGFLSAIDQGHTEMCLYAAICYHKQGDFEKMKEYFDKYIAVYGMSSFLYFEYGEYYISIGNVDAALTCIEQGIACEDQTYIKQLLFEQAYCYKEKCDFDKAYALAQTYISQYPDDEKGRELYEFLDTRVHVDTHPLNDIWELDGPKETEEEYIEEDYEEVY